MKENKRNTKFLLKSLVIIVIIILIIFSILKLKKTSNEDKSNQTAVNDEFDSYINDEVESGVKINTASKLNETKKVDNFLISNIQLTEIDGMTTLLADVTNQSDSKTGMTTFEITLLKKNGTEITTVQGFINELEAGATTQLNIGMTSSYVGAYDFAVKII